MTDLDPVTVRPDPAEWADVVRRGRTTLVGSAIVRSRAQATRRGLPTSRSATMLDQGGSFRTDSGIAGFDRRLTGK